MSLIPASANRTPSTRRRRRRPAGTVSAGLERLEPRQMLAVDINGDGLTDLLWQNDGGGVIAWIGDGIGRNTTATRFVGGDSQWKLTALGDFDGDGVTDVIWRQQATGVCVLWLMRGDGYGLWGSRVLGGDQQWQIEATGDYNGDGRQRPGRAPVVATGRKRRLQLRDPVVDEQFVQLASERRLHERHVVTHGHSKLTSLRVGAFCRTASRAPGHGKSMRAVISSRTTRMRSSPIT